MAEEHLTVIVPCLNEEAAIERTAHSILDVAKDLPMPTTILIIDDASTDGTADAMRRLEKSDSRCKLVQNETRLGVGRSVLNAFEVIQPESWVTGVPGDNEFQFDSIWNHMNVRHQYDVILGYYGNPVIRTFRRRIASVAFTRVINTLYGFSYKYLNGMKLYKLEAFKGIEVKSSGHAFFAELMAKAILRNPNLRIGEVPFIARGRAHGTSRAIQPASIVKAVREVKAGRESVSDYRNHVIRERGDD